MGRGLGCRPLAPRPPQTPPLPLPAPQVRLGIGPGPPEASELRVRAASSLVVVPPVRLLHGSHLQGQRRRRHWRCDDSADPKRFSGAFSAANSATRVCPQMMLLYRLAVGMSIGKPRQSTNQRAPIMLAAVHVGKIKRDRRKQRNSST